MNFKVFSLVLFFQLFILGLLAQNKQYIYYLDENLNSTSKENALIIGKGFKDDDNFRLDCFLSSSNELLLIAFFTDSSLNIFNGGYALYQGHNRIKEEGTYKDNKKNGIWKTYDLSGKIVDSTFYENGVRIKFAKFRYYYNKDKVYNGKLITDSSQYYINFMFTDSLKNEFVSRYYSFRNNMVELERDAFFIGERGIMKTYDSLRNETIDSVFSRKEKEAEYVGGDVGWRQLLINNLKSEIGVNNGAPPGIYKVVVKFVVEVDGSIADVMLENDPGFGMGAEALRVIKLAKKWKPAQQYGKRMKAYRRQPITFQISEEEGRRKLF